MNSSRPADTFGSRTLAIQFVTMTLAIVLGLVFADKLKAMTKVDKK